jgi:hypothetical protein
MTNKEVLVHNSLFIFSRYPKGSLIDLPNGQNYLGHLHLVPSKSCLPPAMSKPIFTKSFNCKDSSFHNFHSSNGTNMRQLIILLIFMATNVCAAAQIRDSTAGYVPTSWKKYHIGIRAAVGIQRTFYTELGLGWQRYTYEARHGFMVTGFYTAFEWTPSVRSANSVHGIKAGLEMVNNGGAGIIEFNYLFNGESEDLVITPKIGFGIGLVNIYYGYNLSTKKYPFPKIGKHQVSLVINTNMLLHYKKYETSRTGRRKTTK